MKYLPTLNLWNNAIQKAVLNGQIKLQTGQWVQCGEGKKSRFVTIKNGVIWAAHWQGNAVATKKRFNILLQAAK